MLTGYLDESGTHPGARVTTVGGFVSTAEAWDTFDREWAALLARAGASRLHMKALAHFKGEYEGWSESRRRQLLRDALFCILRHCRYGCAVSVIEQIDGLLAVDPRMGSAYSLATMGCIARLEEWLKANNLETPMALVLERGCHYSTELVRHLEETERPIGTINNFNPVTFGGPLEFLGLQAADLLVYEQNKFLTDSNSLGRAVQPARVPYQALQVVPHNWTVLGAEEIGGVVMQLILDDLRRGGADEVHKHHPHAQIEIDGQVIEARRK